VPMRTYGYGEMVCDVRRDDQSLATQRLGSRMARCAGAVQDAGGGRGTTDTKSDGLEVIRSVLEGLRSRRSMTGRGPRLLGEHPNRSSSDVTVRVRPSMREACRS
jgi:hypothetical protein